MNFLWIFSILAFYGQCLCRPDQQFQFEINGDPLKMTGFFGDEILVKPEDDEMTKLSISTMKNMITWLEKEINSEELRFESDAMAVAKRAKAELVDSNPHLSKLAKLQQKIAKLDKMIETLHDRHNPNILTNLPEYHRIVNLHGSLLQLLPKKLEETKRLKRSPFSVDFLGMSISYPQYLRLKHLQEKVIRLDKLIRQISMKYPPKLLETKPKWRTLRSLHSSLKKLLPEDYVAQSLESGSRRFTTKRSPLSAGPANNFGSLKLEESPHNLDSVLTKLEEKNDPKDLAKDSTWQELMTLQQNLEKNRLDSEFEMVQNEPET